MLSPSLTARGGRLVLALRGFADDPFAASLAERLDDVLAAPEPSVAALELLGPADLAGLERLRPSEEARATLRTVASGERPPRPDAGVPTPLGARYQPVLLSLATVGAFWLGWIARAVHAARH